MMFHQLENALPIEVRGEQRRNVELVRTTACQQEFELRIEPWRVPGKTLHLNLRCCRQTVPCGLSMSLGEFSFRKLRPLSIESSNSDA